MVAFFPSDHFFSDDAAFVRQIDSAYRTAAFQPDVVILLGVKPKTPAVDYGWIEPGAPLESSEPGSVCCVRRFWEKPGPKLASALMERACLWNTFVMVGHVKAFLNLIRRALPGLAQSFQAIRPSLFAASETEAVRDLYSNIGATSFSQDVLQKHSGHLAVLCAAGLGWSDLGEPSRVFSARERMKLEVAGANGLAESLTWAASASLP